MKHTWEASADGVMALPSGRLIRGRGLHYPLPAGPLPEFGVYLLGKHRRPWGGSPDGCAGPTFGCLSTMPDALDALREAWRRAESERVEVACWRGIGRTGTALACIAILDGVPPDQAVSYVRRHYRRRTVETPVAAAVRGPLQAGTP